MRVWAMVLYVQGIVCSDSAGAGVVIVTVPPPETCIYILFGDVLHICHTYHTYIHNIEKCTKHIPHISLVQTLHGYIEKLFQV